MRAGDYVQLRRRFPPFLRRGTRGRVVEVFEPWVNLRISDNRVSGRVMTVHQDNLTVIDRDEGGIVWQSTQP